MVNLDLDVIAKKADTVKLFGRDVAFKEVTLEQHLLNEYHVKEIEKMPMENQDDVVAAVREIAKYLVEVLDIKEDEAKMISLAQFKALRNYMQRKELYDQGFTDREIDKLQKEALKKQVAALKK